MNCSLSLITWRLLLVKKQLKVRNSFYIIPRLYLVFYVLMANSSYRFQTAFLSCFDVSPSFVMSFLTT